MAIQHLKPKLSISLLLWYQWCKLFQHPQCLLLNLPPKELHKEDNTWSKDISKVVSIKDTNGKT